MCRATVCGNGVVEGLEQCDDGNVLPFDDCSPTCTNQPQCVTANGTRRACNAICGDGITFPTEKCDDGKNTGDYGTCNPDCTLAPHCGDHVVQADKKEECDDGNSTAGDGCSPACTTEILR